MLTFYLDHDEPPAEFKRKIKWASVFALTYLHVAGLYGIYLSLWEVKFETVLIAFIISAFAGKSIIL